MLKFCSNPECSNFEGFIPSGGECSCGSGQEAAFRYGTSECDECGEQNPVDRRECWNCSGTLT